MALHVTEWGQDAAEPPAVFVHGVLSWGDDPLYGFGNQRPLAERHRLRLLDRRGHGRSPDSAGTHGTDYEQDAADIVEALGTGAHLVGHSYGAVGAMLAAAARPDLVRSLCLIQPGCLRVAEDDPVVAEVLRRNRAATASLPADLSAGDFLRLATEAVGMPVPDPTPWRLRAAASAMTERPCWDADVPVAAIAAAPWPILVVVGDWAGAPEDYRRHAGEPLTVTARAVARRTGGRLQVVPGYYPQTQQADLVNDALAALWAAAGP